MRKNIKRNHLSESLVAFICFLIWSLDSVAFKHIPKTAQRDILGGAGVLWTHHHARSIKWHSYHVAKWDDGHIEAQALPRPATFRTTYIQPSLSASWEYIRGTPSLGWSQFSVRPWRVPVGFLCCVSALAKLAGLSMSRSGLEGNMGGGVLGRVSEGPHPQGNEQKSCGVAHPRNGLLCGLTLNKI